MEHRFIEKTIMIEASVTKVWDVFTDPEITRQMGGYYDTDWKIGSSFGFKTMSGNRLTNGTVLEYQPERLIKHNLFEPNGEKVMAVITYSFQEKDGHTLLTGNEQFTKAYDSAAFKDASEGWELALHAIKELAESLQ